MDRPFVHNKVNLLFSLDVIGAYGIVFITSYIYNFKLRSKVENLYEIVEKKVAERIQEGEVI